MARRAAEIGLQNGVASGSQGLSPIVEGLDVMSFGATMRQHHQRQTLRIGDTWRRRQIARNLQPVGGGVFDRPNGRNLGAGHTIIGAAQPKQ
ncbi:hypothetical protein D3C80_1262640 [compost metagenome]